MWWAADSTIRDRTYPRIPHVGWGVRSIRSLSKDPTYGGFECRKIVIDGTSDDRVRRVEVAVGEVIPHPCDVGPRDL